MVMGILSLILSMTGRLSVAKDVPKSKRTILVSHDQYWTCRGLSRP